MSKETKTVGGRLYWAYANLAMAEIAVHDDAPKYEPKHYMIRAKIFREMCAGQMSVGSLMKDQRIRMKLPQECVYCGSTDHLSIDHVVPTNRGGVDLGDNAIWACRSCNSSKSDTDLFIWWKSKRDGYPPLFPIRIYIKQAILYHEQKGLLEKEWDTVEDSPFVIKEIPQEFPQPPRLIFTPHHQTKRGVEAS